MKIVKLTLAGVVVCASTALWASNTAFKLTLTLQPASPIYTGTYPVSLPYHTALVDAVSICNDIGTNALTVGMYDKYTKSYLLKSCDTNTGLNFPVPAGAGIDVTVQSPTTWNIIGAHDNGLGVPLKADGGNFISVPYHTTATTALQLLRQIPGGYLITRVNPLVAGNNVQKCYDNVPGDPTLSCNINFPITPGEAYGVQVSADTTWVPAFRDDLGLDAYPLPGGDPSGGNSTSSAAWSVASVDGPRYSVNAGASWINSTGWNDYTVPTGNLSMMNWKVVRPLGINPENGFRNVVAGGQPGLWRSVDGGDTWRYVSGGGSGLENTSQNFEAILTTTTAYGGTDILAGVTGTSNGGVYLSGDRGEHWTQINQGFDPSNLNIATLVVTSCGGCPVNYYSGTYGSGTYTRTIAVNPSPSITGWRFGSASGTCGTDAKPYGALSGSQPFVLCGANFLALPTVEFDGVPARGCVWENASRISCAGTPPHVPGAVKVRVRNTDTRDGYLPVKYIFTGGVGAFASRTGTSLRAVKSLGGAVQLTWSCPTCDALVRPARIYRSQDGDFHTFREHYVSGIGGAYDDVWTVLPQAQPLYFWRVE
jgi:hypothetical protein